MKNDFIFSVRSVILSLITVLYGDLFFAQNITLDGKTDDWAAALNGHTIKAFARDANAINDDQFTGGSSDPGLVTTWSWSNGNTNSKGDISNAAAVLIGNRIYFAADRTAINGDAAIGFWFFINGTKKNPGGTFSPEHSVGDLLVLSNFTNGGGSVQLKIYKWVGSGGSNGSLDLIGTTGNAFVNSSYQPTPSYSGWTYQGNNVPSVGTPPANTYATGAFFEGFVDFSPGSGISPCFSSFLLETRNSQSINASLQDFVSGTFNIKPLAPNVTPSKNCGPGNVTVSAECATGTQIRWYAEADAAAPLSSGGNISISGNSLTANISATTTFYAACYNAATGCESERLPVTATVNTPPQISVEYTPILCNGGQSTVTVSASGGKAPYSGTGTFDVGAGTYNYTVTDANGCTDSKEIVISQPDKLLIKVEYTPILCNGGESTVTVSASGGTAPYSGTGTFNVGAGTHNYTVTDANGCTDSKEIVISQPDQLVIKVEATPILCNGGQTTVTVSATGGTAPYSGIGTFSVAAGTHNYTVTDANGCTDSKEIVISQPDKLVIKVEYTTILCNGGESTVTVSASGGTAPYSGTGTFNVGAGTYTYTVKDANNCSDSKEILISQPDKLVVKVEYNPILCNGGESTVTVSASGGTAPYSGTGTFNVGAGTHNYTVTDANNCSDSKEIVISQPDQLVIKVEATPILCNGGKSTVTVSATGGTGPYSGDIGTFTVGAGTYTYTVTDANGCTDTKSITVTQPDPPKVELSAPPITCNTQTVTVTATASGGTAPYTYLWSNGSTSSTADLGVGVYSVTVTDANGCTASASGEIKAPLCGGFTTVTQGGWGAKASGNNWGKYRDTHFAGAFPTGLTVGAGSRFLKLTSAKAVDDFLPSGTTARALNSGTMTNPGANYSNVLAGQTVALTLNVTFDLYDPNFSASTSHLGDLIVSSGTFANWTVYQVLAEANKILGGEPSSYSASEINAIVDAINNNYDGGKVNLGLLACPCPGTPPAKGIDTAAVAEPKAIVPEVQSAIVLYPNPSNGEFNVKFEAEAGSKVLVQVYDMTGKLVGDYSSKVVRNGSNASLNVSENRLAGGLYLVKVKTSKQEKTIKLIIKK